MLRGRICLCPRLRNGLDPFWDMIQTNSFFFNLSVVGDPQGNTVQSALIITAQWPGAHLHLVALCTTPGCGPLGGPYRRPGSSCSSFKTSICFPGDFE